MKRLNLLNMFLFFFLISAFTLTRCFGGSDDSPTGVAVTGVSLNKSNTAILAGGTEQLTATITPSNATNQNVTWTSSNGSAVTVSTGGLVSVIFDGTATITVATVDGNFTASCEVTVSAQTAYAFDKSWNSSPYPRSIAFDAANNVYVTDATGNGMSGADHVDIFDSDGNYLGGFGSYGTADDQFRSPFGIALDSYGNIYVADSYNQYVKKFNSNLQYQTKFTMTSINYYVSGLAIDKYGNIYVTASIDDKIEKFNSSMQSQWSKANGDTYTSDGVTYGLALDTPITIAVDNNCNVYVAASNNGMITKFDTNGNHITEWGSSGNSDGQFNVLYGVAVDNYGYVYTVEYENHRVQKFKPDGTFLCKFGSDQLSLSQGIAVDNSGNVYVADTISQKIVKFNPVR